MMKERPILFSDPMIRALRAGRKTQTRRVMKTQPTECGDGRLNWSNTHRSCSNVTLADLSAFVPCPYGQPGDRLWVKETFAVGYEVNDDCCITDEDGYDLPEKFFYRATTPSNFQGLTWKPSIYMPRRACRIKLEITDVRVQRVQDISEADAQAEGVTLDCPVGNIIQYAKAPYVCAFAQLWDSINAERGFGWDVNPWVRCLTFRMVD